MKILRNNLLNLFFITLILFSSCKKEDNPVDSEGANQTGVSITTGSSVSVTTQSIGTGGGTIKVSSPGSPVNGLEVIVPQNAYTDSRSFSVSYATVQSHNFGANFNPVSPLITIKNGGGYSSEPLTVKIPMKKAKDEFAVAYFYNEVNGKLEALPILAENDSVITIKLRHFSTSSLSLNKKLFKGQLDQTAQGNLIVSSIKESILSNQVVLNTSYSPGTDDWEFINYGSYISPGGHCAGQSMTSMWYYYEKKLKGEASLFHRYDTYCNTSDLTLLWQDNPYGYRFASTIQEDFNWGNWILKVDLQSYVPSLIWKTFIAAMLVTGEPQFVIIKESKSGAGHAMVVYKINLSESKLYIADPNYPGNKTRTINYVNGSFQSYNSALNANSNALQFDQIAFFGKTANIDWSQIGTRFTEFQNKTIGNDRFPQYDLYHIGTSQISLVDGMTFEKDTLKVQCSSASAVAGINNSKLQLVNIYDPNGNLLSTTNLSGNNVGIASYILKPGKNVLGFAIMCGAQTSYNPVQYGWRFDDFKWITLNKLALTSINPTQGLAGTAVTLKGGGFKSSQGSSTVLFNGLPASVSSWNDSLITTSVPQNATTGNVTVVVDGKTSNGIKFTVATPVNLNGLDQTTKIQVGIEGTTLLGTQTNITSVTVANTDGFSTVGYFAYPECPLKWNGATFKVQGVHVRSTYQRDSVYISGTVSNDGKTILAVDVAYRYYGVSSTDGSLTDEEKINFTLTNVPSYVFIAGNYSFLTMSSPASKISNFKWTRWIKGNPIDNGSFTSVLYIHVDFE